MRRLAKSVIAYIRRGAQHILNWLRTASQWQLVLVALAVISGLTTMLSAPLLISMISFLTLAAVLCVLLVTTLVARSRRVPPVPPLDFLPAAPYRIVQASEEDVRWAAGTAKRVYTGLDVIRAPLMLEWFKANPSGFSVIKDCNGHRCGNLDILPLKPDTLSRFLRGELIEQEIRGDSIFGRPESKKIQSLYIESLVALSEGDEPNPLATYKCLMSVLELARRICDPSQVKKLYAIGASKGGICLMKHVGFDKIDYEQPRRDGHDVFCVDFQDLCKYAARHANGTNKVQLWENLNKIWGKPTL